MIITKWKINLRGRLEARERDINITPFPVGGVMMYRAIDRLKPDNIGLATTPYEALGSLIRLEFEGMKGGSHENPNG